MHKHKKKARRKKKKKQARKQKEIRYNATRTHRQQQFEGNGQRYSLAMSQFIILCCIRQLFSYDREYCVRKSLNLNTSSLKRWRCVKLAAITRDCIANTNIDRHLKVRLWVKASMLFARKCCNWLNCLKILLLCCCKNIWCQIYVYNFTQ